VRGLISGEYFYDLGHWMVLPFDSTLRFRVSVSGYGIILMARRPAASQWIFLASPTEKGGRLLI